MIIGEIGYLNKEKDEAYVRILSTQNFLEKLHFKPSLVQFEIQLGKIICVSQKYEKNDFLEFNIKNHERFLNLDEIKLKSGGISIPNNIDLMDYLIDNEIDNITSIFAQYVNESDFTEFEKTGMLTLFENFKTNRKLFDETAPFDFLQFINSAPVGANGKPSLDTACGGTMVVNMHAGSLGGPLGFLGGCATGVWGCYTLGCFD